jgi:signal peptidase II
MRQRFLAFFALFLALGLFGCDHASKHYAATRLQPPASPLAVVPGVVELRYTENHDTAFSLTRVVSSANKSSILVGLALLGVVAVGAAWWRRRKTASPLQHVAFAAIASGALGNAVDRVLRGFVVDFIHVRVGWLDWPIFNVADVAVTIGVALLLVSELRKKPNAEPAPPPPA